MHKSAEWADSHTEGSPSKARIAGVGTPRDKDAQVEAKGM